ncbi:60S ribosomal protein L7, putative [Leishmania tarentolae]|uniref:60S ribosomal protein L7, putative n=1 Tax=Leishmania tarentolae TaxID=5689 RepID=A0A640KJY0_LEITA|nr:60S ribosomal protein L7, putative [Leishmania tarentolae]
MRGCGCLDHAGEEAVDQGIAVTIVATLHEVTALLAHAAGRGSQLEGPQAVRHRAEVLATGVDLVHHILSAHNVRVVVLVLDHLVVRDLHALAVDFQVAALIHHRPDGCQGRVAVRDVGLHRTQHVLHRLVHLHEHRVEDLAQAQKLQDLALLRVHLGDTADAGHHGNLRLRLEVVVTVRGGLAAQRHQLLLRAAVLAGVLAGTHISGLLQGSLGSLAGHHGILEALRLLLLERSALDRGLRGRNSGHVECFAVN